MATVLWQRHMRYDPTRPDWPDRDRFVLSPGHGSALLYALLHVAGYDVSLDDLKDFRQWGSSTPGHPEYGHTPGVEATTGPLGQGSANAVGMAIAERFLAQHFNEEGHTIVDHFTYALVSDGDLMEGISHEAASLAGHLGLGKLIYLYDANDVTLDGPADLTFTEDVAARYETYGWHVQTVEDGDTDLEAIDAAITLAKTETARPSLIVVKTTIGFGSPAKAGTAACHGAPLGADEVRATKEALDWDPDATFHVPDEVRARSMALSARGVDAHHAWSQRFHAWSKDHPEQADAWRRAIAGELPKGWTDAIPRFEPGTKIATRAAAGKIMNAIAGRVPWLIGGDADLGCSTKTQIANEDDFDGRSGAGRNIRYGVREHAMGAIANGIAYHGGAHSFTGTFFVFADYMRPAMRMAAMNRLPVVHVFTHDSIGVGEDGPTHQPVEHLASLRAMPGLLVLRPADAGETASAWRLAMEAKRPSALVLSRQGLPVLDRTHVPKKDGVSRGAYVLAEASGSEPRALLIATGSEVALALDAREELERAGIPTRVVSMPSWELFAEQDQDWRDRVLPPAITARFSIEAGATFGWERWIGDAGTAIGIDRFGASAPGDVNFERLGFTVEHVVRTVRAKLGGEALS
jgi:transketolase